MSGIISYAYERKVNSFIRKYERTVEKETRRIHRLMEKYGRPYGTTKRSTRSSSR
jgi:hypothetical protein